MPSKRTLWVGSAALAVAAVLTPATVSPDQGLQPNNACADAACCLEFLSVCGDAMDYYESASGKCDNKPGFDG